MSQPRLPTTALTAVFAVALFAASPSEGLAQTVILKINTSNLVCYASADGGKPTRLPKEDLKRLPIDDKDDRGYFRTTVPGGPGTITTKKGEVKRDICWVRGGQVVTDAAIAIGRNASCPPIKVSQAQPGGVRGVGESCR